MAIEETMLILHIHYPEKEIDNIGTFEQGLVYLVFCTMGRIHFGFGPNYIRSLDAGKAFIIYDPDRSLPYKVKFEPASKSYLLKLSLAELHNLFAPETDKAPIFKPENAHQKFYNERDLPSELIPVLHQLDEVKLSDQAKRIFLKAKSLEVLSLFFSGESNNENACPYLNNDQLVKKIYEAKALMLQNFAQPDNLTQIARKVGLNEVQFKVGFKKIYGNTPYQFVLDYKLEYARQLLLQKGMHVNLVANEIGYINVSHFISAFKRKFGITPKKLQKL
jgi:AraC-like DNA-binding protein